MCKLVQYKNGQYVAELKYRHILNIARQAAKCKNINRIILFGSSIEERCTERSDIDIAVFGEKTKGKYLDSKEFKDFHKNLYTFDWDQDYDILYFTDGKNYKDRIMEDIKHGVEIYRKA